MVNVCNRWMRDHTDDLQHAFFNGVGFESWENIWGIWNGLTPRDAEAIRRIAHIERPLASLLASPEWVPHVPTLQPGIFTTRFPGEDRTLWTVVNRMEYDVTGPELRVKYQPSARYFDLWHGVELSPVLATNAEGTVSAELAFEIEGHSYGAVLATQETPDPDLKSLLASMKKLAEKPLAAFSFEWKFLPQDQVEIKPTPAAKFSAARHGQHSRRSV